MTLFGKIACQLFCLNIGFVISRKLVRLDLGISIVLAQYTANPKNVVRTERKKLTITKDSGISYFSN